MPVRKMKLAGRGGRVAIVDGLRTPFARIATHYRDLNAIDLGAMAVKELMARNNLSQHEIEQLVFGMTVMIPEAPFIAREIALALGMDTVDAYSITRACATSFQTTASVADNIVAGYTDMAIAGGTDSTSSARVPLSSELSAVLRDVSFAKTLKERIKLLSQLKARDLLPQAPSITEYSVGETMGESTEKMVKKWGVSRQEQDDLAHASHSNAARAWAEGRLDRQVMTAHLPNGNTLKDDNLVRKQSEREGYSKLKPVFDRETGSVTAGNSSPLTDGAGALLMTRSAPRGPRASSTPATRRPARASRCGSTCPRPGATRPSPGCSRPSTRGRWRTGRRRSAGAGRSARGRRAARTSRATTWTTCRSTRPSRRRAGASCCVEVFCP